MALVSGMAAQIGFVGETVYGTYAAPTRFFPLVSESMKKVPKRLESEGIISGARVLRSQQWAAGDVEVDGTVELELYDRSIGLLLKWCFGTVVTAGAAPFTHTFSPGDLSDDFFTMQVGKPGKAGTVHPFSYLGCMVKSWEIACKAGEIATFGMDVVAQDVVTSQALVANSLSAGIKPMTYVGGAVTIGGVSTKVREMKVSGDNSLAIDDRRFLGSPLIDQPLEADLREIKGSIECDFNDLAEYNRLVNASEFALVWTMAAGAQTLVTTMNVRYDDGNPMVADRGVLKQQIPYVAVGPTSDAGAITSVFTTTEATPEVPLGGRAIEVHGLKELSRDLKRIDADLPKQMRKAGLTVARLVADEAARQAGRGTRIQRKAAGAIKAAAGAANASVTVKPTSAIPFAFGAFFGAKRFKQFEPWVGAEWKTGVAGEGPYAINPAIVALEDRIVAVHSEAIDEIVKQAFPN